MNGMQILAVSGSLRTGSKNTVLLAAARALAAEGDCPGLPAGLTVELYAGLGRLPHFNPDDDVEPAHPEVADLRARLRAAAGVLISSPEYAHGVPGSLKNALDWVVGSGELVDKPVALWNASPLSTFAPASLAETLRVMNTQLVPDAFVTLPFGAWPDAAAFLADPEIRPRLVAALGTLAGAVRIDAR